MTEYYGQSNELRQSGDGNSLKYHIEKSWTTQRDRTQPSRSQETLPSFQSTVIHRCCVTGDWSARLRCLSKRFSISSSNLGVYLTTNRTVPVADFNSCTAFSCEAPSTFCKFNYFQIACLFLARTAHRSRKAGIKSGCFSPPA